MQYLILGAGAVGGHLGATLISAGAKVDFLVRPRRASQLSDNGLVIRKGEEVSRCPVNILLSGQIKRPYDTVLVCCKAYDLEDAVDAIRPAIRPNTAVMPVLNGMKHIDMLNERLGQEHVLGCLTQGHGALAPNGDIIRSPYTASHAVTEFGEQSGEISARCLAVQDDLVVGGINAQVSEAIIPAMWGKFAAFAWAATVCVLCRSRAGGVAVAPAGAALVSYVAEECDRIATAAGHPIPESIKTVVRGLLSQPGSQYAPSLWIDAERGHKTEAEYVIGDMVDRAERLRLSAPLMTAARCAMQIYEASLSKG
jgi:2-dehydropantoate 2-reductase